ncbi:NAD(P)-binding domain-containing protein [Solicola gregarius]|uniref:NAD(P)-binding domain-containing protein n=1 Tax=Solicola gregarius TaxID=2908642 RepID=A0AA46YPK1_9ACTN|nr:NAD(P)-binding domain-containing protein [Solicola gregarius]UYM07693.1 NAD(P)-binding domain-containing protein [Solicola gregarius]
MSDLPVAVIGAGPTGLAAAAHLRTRGRAAVVLEAGPSAGTAVRDWAHVRLFSPWRELIDPSAAALLDASGWQTPDGDRYPTGGDWVDGYLQPLADALDPVVHYGARVTGVARSGRDRLVDSGRDGASFVVHVNGRDGEERIEASAVLDASGTWSRPNPLGGDGLPALGESAARVTYRVPDLRDPSTRDRYAGKHIAVAGTGASAMTALVALGELADEAPGTRVSWLVRRGSATNAFGGGDNDQLVERGALGRRAQQAVNAGHVRTSTGFRARALVPHGEQVDIESFDGQRVERVDEIVAVTGMRPDLSYLSEIRLDLDPVLHSPKALAPLIDPNIHSCGTVYPHGAKELAQPDAGFYLVGMKSYGRAPSFLAMTGYEQVRSVVAEIAGDHEAAERVELTLPDTGVCGGAGLFDEDESAASGGCCGTATDEVLTIGGTIRG